jgi:hypothetical protein
MRGETAALLFFLDLSVGAGFGFLMLGFADFGAAGGLVKGLHDLGVGNILAGVEGGAHFGVIGDPLAQPARRHADELGSLVESDLPLSGPAKEKRVEGGVVLAGAKAAVRAVVAGHGWLVVRCFVRDLICKAAGLTNRKFW